MQVIDVTEEDAEDMMRSIIYCRDPSWEQMKEEKDVLHLWANLLVQYTDVP